MKLVTLIALPMIFGCATNSAFKQTKVYFDNSDRIINVLRPDNRVGSAIGVDVFVNNEKVASVKVNALLKYPVKEGKYKIRIGEGEGKDLFLAQEIEIDLTKKNICIELLDDKITDENGGHLSLKPVIREDYVCAESKLDVVPFK
jgi:hypothetical protein